MDTVLLLYFKYFFQNYILPKLSLFVGGQLASNQLVKGIQSGVQLCRVLVHISEPSTDDDNDSKRTGQTGPKSKYVLKPGFTSRPL